MIVVSLWTYFNRRQQLSETNNAIQIFKDLHPNGAVLLYPILTVTIRISGREKLD
jgi:hypothetical protein